MSQHGPVLGSVLGPARLMRRGFGYSNPEYPQRTDPPHPASGVLILWADKLAERGWALGWYVHQT